MYVGSLVLTLYLPECRSLKDKRQVVQSVLTRLRVKHRVAAAEVDAMEIWSQAVLGCACVANTHSHAQSIMDSIVHWVEEHWDVDITDVRIAIL